MLEKWNLYIRRTGGVRKGEKAVLRDGTLAGSILKMNQAALNMMDFTGCSLEDIVYMTAVNPARQLHIYDRKGSIRSGKMPI